jgi:DNA-binding MarR family transcriptional regulator
MSQVKALLLLRGAEGAPRPVSEIADALGLSVAAMSRAVEGLVKKRLVTRVTDAQDRRVRLVAASQKGQALANELMASRMAGIESFTETLSAAQRRRIDAAVDALFDRDEIASAYKQLKAVAK